MVKNSTGKVNPSQERLFSAFLTGSSLNWTLQEIAEEITTQPGVIHAIEKKSTCFQIYFFQETERDTFVERKELTNGGRNLQISLPQEVTQYFITGVPKKLTENQIKKQLTKHFVFIKASLIRETKAKIFNGTVKITLLATSPAPVEIQMLGKKCMIKKLKEKEESKEVNEQAQVHEEESSQKDDVEQVNVDQEESSKQEVETKQEVLPGTETPKKKKKKRKANSPLTSPPHKILNSSQSPIKDDTLTQKDSISLPTSSPQSLWVLLKGKIRGIDIIELADFVAGNKPGILNGVERKGEFFRFLFFNYEDKMKLLNQKTIRYKNRIFTILDEKGDA